MSVINLDLNNRAESLASLSELGLIVGSDGKILADDVELVISKLKYALAEQQAQLVEVASIKDVKSVSELEFAKLCGNIDGVLEEFSIENITQHDKVTKSGKIIRLFA